MIFYTPKISANKLSTAGRNSFGQSSIHMSLNKLYLDCLFTELKIWLWIYLFLCFTQMAVSIIYQGKFPGKA